jgi:hypothetical protein
MVWTGFIWPIAGSCEHDDEFPGSIECYEFLDLMSNYYLASGM